MVTVQKMTFAGFDETKYEKFVAKNKAAIAKLAKRRGDELTDEQAEKAARSMSEMYHHHFRIWK